MNIFVFAFIPTVFAWISHQLYSNEKVNKKIYRSKNNEKNSKKYSEKYQSKIQICETIFDCESPQNCCDYVFIKICCNDGILIPIPVPVPNPISNADNYPEVIHL